MDDSARATHQEELARNIALRNALHASTGRDYPAEICPGCQYATKSNFGKTCEAWAECLADQQKRERAGR